MKHLYGETYACINVARPGGMGLTIGNRTDCRVDGLLYLPDYS